MIKLKRLYVVCSLVVVLFATFQFLQVVGLFPVLSLQNQFTLQFQVKPGLFLLFGILQCAILFSIHRKYRWIKDSQKIMMERLDHAISANTTHSLIDAASILRDTRIKRRSNRRDLSSNEHSKNVSSLFNIYYRRKSGNSWYDIHPKPESNDKGAKIFSWPFTYTYNEKLSWDENISKFKSRYYLCLAITILSPFYQVVINFAYIFGLSARAMECLWQYPYLFSIVFLLDIILTGNMLRQTSGDTIL